MKDRRMIRTLKQIMEHFVFDGAFGQLSPSDEKNVVERVPASHRGYASAVDTRGAVGRGIPTDSRKTALCVATVLYVPPPLGVNRRSGKGNSIAGRGERVYASKEYHQQDEVAHGG